MNTDARAKWTQKVRQYKHEYMIKELDLRRDQQKDFFALYDAMEDELMAIAEQSRQLEARIDALGDRATEGELTSAARTLYDQKARESEVETSYYDKLAKVLTPRQLFRLRGVERDFTFKVVRQHGRKHAEERRKDKD